MRYQQIFWDFDGTLIDTYPGMVTAFHDALVCMGVNDFEIDDLAIYRVMRQHSFKTARQQFSAEFSVAADRLETVYQRKVADKLAPAKPFAGAATILTAITAAGGRNFLLTHRDAGALDYLDQAGLRTAFTGVVTASDHYPRKPDPTSLRALCQQYGVAPQTAIMVGDRNLDIQAGHSAGMAGALFDPEHLIVAESRPEIRVTRLADLQDWLMKGARQDGGSAANA